MVWVIWCARRRLELPAYWFEAMNARTINNIPYVLLNATIDYFQWLTRIA
jgi:hypothetical protein